MLGILRVEGTRPAVREETGMYCNLCYGSFEKIVTLVRYQAISRIRRISFRKSPQRQPQIIKGDNECLIDTHTSRFLNIVRAKATAHSTVGYILILVYIPFGNIAS